MLLLRQSLLLLRPPHDPDLKTYRKKKSAIFLKRCKLHGLGAGIALLPLLLLLLLSKFGTVTLAGPMENPAQQFLSAALLCWLAVLFGTRFSRYVGLCFSSRDSGIGDFGRRLPLYPDLVLCLLELSYLTGLWFYLFSEPRYFPRDFYVYLWTLRIVLSLGLLWVLYRNLELGYRTFQSFRDSSGFQRTFYWSTILEYKKIGRGPERLSLLRIEVDGLETRDSDGLIPMGFSLLRFPAQKNRPFLGASRADCVDHPLSLWSQEVRGGKQIWEFLLEHKGNLTGLSEALLRPGIELMVWGPYWDAEPDFLTGYFSEKISPPLLLFAYNAGLAPLLRLLKQMERFYRFQKIQKTVKVHLFAVSSALDSKLEQFWNRQIGQTEEMLRSSPIRLTVHREKISPHFDARDPNQELFVRYMGHLAAADLESSLEVYWEKITPDLAEDREPAVLVRGGSSFQKLVSKWF